MRMKVGNVVFSGIAVFALVCGGAPVVKVEKAGAEKVTVAVNVTLVGSLPQSITIPSSLFSS